MDAQGKHYLQAMGIDLWRAREGFFPEEAQATPAVQSASPVSFIEGPDWPALQQQVASCTACGLHEGRTNTVFGVGNQQADWMVIGEAPGRDEDLQGEPFVGAAGQLLNEMLFALGFQREQIYIANVLKCRPPNNRDPQPEEVAQCEHFLMRQIELVQPKVILSVGRISAQNLLKTETRVGQLRGQVFRFGPRQIPLVVTYHPAYLLRSPLEKRKAWMDLKLARSVMQEKS